MQIPPVHRRWSTLLDHLCRAGSCADDLHGKRMTKSAPRLLPLLAAERGTRLGFARACSRCLTGSLRQLTTASCIIAACVVQSDFSRAERPRRAAMNVEHESGHQHVRCERMTARRRYVYVPSDRRVAVVILWSVVRVCDPHLDTFMVPLGRPFSCRSFFGPFEGLMADSRGFPLLAAARARPTGLG